MRTFSLKDDCTLSGRRLHYDARRVEGGGYVDPAGGALVPAHGVVLVPAEGTKRAARPGDGRALQWKGEKEVAEGVEAAQLFYCHSDRT